MAAHNHGTAPLLADGLGDTENSTSVTRDSIKHKYYTLPSLRYSSVVRAIVFIDVVFSLALWISGSSQANMHIYCFIYLLFLLY